MKVRRIVRNYEEVLELPDIFHSFNERIKEGAFMTEEVVKLCHKLIGEKTVEHMLALYFQPDGSYVDYEIVGVGNNSYVQATPFAILSPAMGLNTSFFCLCHNHPGAVALPSDEDSMFTDSIHALSKMFYAHMIDHVIVNPDGAYSMRQGLSYMIEGGEIIKKETVGEEAKKAHVIQSIESAQSMLEAMLQNKDTDITVLKALFQKAKENIGMAPKDVDLLLKKEELKKIKEYKQELEEMIKKAQ